MIVFAHTKFGLVQIQGSGVKRGTESAPLRSERVFFQIPVQIGLRPSLHDAGSSTYRIPFHIGLGLCLYGSA